MDLQGKLSQGEKGRLSGVKVREGDQVAIMMGPSRDGGWARDVFLKEVAQRGLGTMEGGVMQRSGGHYRTEQMPGRLQREWSVMYWRGARDVGA